MVKQQEKNTIMQSFRKQLSVFQRSLKLADCDKIKKNFGQ